MNDEIEDIVDWLRHWAYPPSDNIDVDSTLLESVADEIEQLRIKVDQLRRQFLLLMEEHKQCSVQQRMKQSTGEPKHTSWRNY